jgi:L-ectoine synthase
MIVKNLTELLGTDREVDVENWTSRRFLLKGDGMGFSMHDTVIKAGTETFIWYAHHLEAVYCIEGCGEVEVVETGELYPIEAGTLYALDGHEKHYLRAHTQMRMVCVFNPPLTGKEVHDDAGVYPIIEDEDTVRAVSAAD